MKIAAAQTVISRDMASNGEAIRQLLVDAAADRIKLVTFCEGALSGYCKAQITNPEDWQTFDWDMHEAELRSIASLCARLNIFAVIGGAHKLSQMNRPHNSLYIISSDGEIRTRYDKRYLSNTEINDWYTPGTAPIVFDVDTYRFGCAICIECQFPEVFMEYERLGVDAVLFSSYGIPEHFEIALRAHAGLNCLWIAASTPAQETEKGPAGIIGPDGKWCSLCPASANSDYATSILNRDDPTYEIPLKKARPWRRKARQGDIYREKMTIFSRSLNKKDY